MKSYTIVTGSVFGLITLAHLWRIIVEWPRLATDPFFLFLTVVVAALCVWAWRLIRVSARS